jgi:threonyl-tRNA synthetase
MTNVNGKEDTAFTVQYDFVMPKRFKLTYTNEEGKDEEPIVIHRSSIGAIERVLAFLIERYNGAFPLWLSPTQVSLLPISDKHLGFAKKVKEQLQKTIPMLRVHIDDRSESIGKKIREATTQKVPYMLIIGDKEIDSNGASVRTLAGEDLGTMPLADLVQKMTQEITNKQ